MIPYGIDLAEPPKGRVIHPGPHVDEAALGVMLALGRERGVIGVR